MDEGLALAEEAWSGFVTELGADHERSRRHASAILAALEKLGRESDAASWRRRAGKGR